MTSRALRSAATWTSAVAASRVRRWTSTSTPRSRSRSAAASSAVLRLLLAVEQRAPGGHDLHGRAQRGREVGGAAQRGAAGTARLDSDHDRVGQARPIGRAVARPHPQPVQQADRRRQAALGGDAQQAHERAPPGGLGRELDRDLDLVPVRALPVLAQRPSSRSAASFSASTGARKRRTPSSSARSARAPMSWRPRPRPCQSSATRRSAGSASSGPVRTNRRRPRCRPRAGRARSAPRGRGGRSSSGSRRSRSDRRGHRREEPPVARLRAQALEPCPRAPSRSEASIGRRRRLRAVGQGDAARPLQRCSTSAGISTSRLQDLAGRALGQVRGRDSRPRAGTCRPPRAP